MFKQQHNTLTNVKNVKSKLTTPLKAYCITVLKAVYYVEWSIMRERDVITCIWYSIHSSVQSHILNKTLVWISAEESVIFDVLSFHLLRAIFDGSAAQCICCIYIRALDWNQNGRICDSVFYFFWECASEINVVAYVWFALLQIICVCSRDMERCSRSPISLITWREALSVRPLHG